MDDSDQRSVAADAIGEFVTPSTARTAIPKKERTDEQRAQRQTLRAAKLARKQQEAAALRQQKAVQIRAEQPSDERKGQDEEEVDGDEQLDGSGSAVYGNFHNYYAFNVVSERLRFITDDFIQHVLHRTSPRTTEPPPHPTSVEPPPHTLLPPCTCSSSSHSLPPAFPPPERPHSANDAVYVCDLGCNEGDLTFELVTRLSAALADGRPVVAVGVDIDGELIRRARTKFTLPAIESFLHAPLPSDSSTSSAASYLSFYQANLICSDTFAALHSLHPTSITHSSVGSTVSSPPFHLVTCFSLLMWLHLCYGSTVLCQYLAALCPLTTHLVIELQGWRHYRSAVERRRRGGSDESVWQWSAIEEEWRGRGGAGVRERVVSVLAAGGIREVAVLGRTKWGREVIWFARHTRVD